MGTDWKRKKWLLKNLTFPQLVKYVFVKKRTINKADVIPYDVTPYDISEKVEIGRKGTILIKPSGIKQTGKILNELKKEGASVSKCIRINDYRAYARSVFHMVSEEEQNIWFQILDNYYRQSSNEALLLYLDTEIKETARIKHRIRKKIGIDFFKVVRDKDSYITSLTPVHSSNKKERVYEENAIRSMLKDHKAEQIDSSRLLHGEQ